MPPSIFQRLPLPGTTPATEPATQRFQNQEIGSTISQEDLRRVTRDQLLIPQQRRKEEPAPAPSHYQKQADEARQLREAAHLKVIETVLERDKAAPQAAKLAADPALKELAQVHTTVSRHAGGFPGLRLTDAAAIADISVAVTRNIAGAQQLPSETEVLKALQDISARRLAASKLSLFEGRNAVIAAHLETWSDTRDHAGKSLSENVRQAVLTSTGDIHRFASQELINRVSSAVGKEQSVALIRPEQTAERKLLNLLATRHETLARLNEPPGSPRYLADPAVQQFKTLVRQALDLPAEQPILVSFRAGKSGEVGVFRVYDENKRSLFDASLALKEGRPVDIVGDWQERPVYTRSPHEAKAQILEAIRTTPPGPNGFLFTFEGHGSPQGLYLSDGQPLDMGFRETKETVCISPRDLATAIKARAELYGRSEKDLYVFNCCFPKDFADALTRELEGSKAQPNLLCQNEYQQFGYTEANIGEGMLFMKSLLDIDQHSRKTDGAGASIGDMINALQIKSLPLKTNPVLLMPGQDRENPLRVKGYQQIGEVRGVSDTLPS